MDQLTRTEAETLAIMLNSAGNHMARARDPHTHAYVWEWTGESHAYKEMLDGFYELAPPLDYEVYV